MRVFLPLDVSVYQCLYFLDKTARTPPRYVKHIVLGSSIAITSGIL